MSTKSADVRPPRSAVRRTRQPRVTPEEQELSRKREEQAALEADLADRELRFASLRGELAAFERRYLHFVASRYAELDELKAQIADRLFREQPESARARLAANEARARANETRTVAGESSSQPPRKFDPSPELRRLYREAARRIHPDFTSETAERLKRERLMAEVNAAYENGDEGRIAGILGDYECSPEAVEGDGPAAELIRVIRRLNQICNRAAEIESETQILLQSDLHQLKLRVDEAERHGHDLLKFMVERVEHQITLAKERLVKSSLPSIPS